MYKVPVLLWTGAAQVTLQVMKQFQLGHSQELTACVPELGITQVYARAVNSGSRTAFVHAQCDDGLIVCYLCDRMSS